MQAGASAKASVVTRKRTGLGSDLASVVGAMCYAHATSRDVLVDWRRSRYLADPAVNLFAELFQEPFQVTGLSVAAAPSDFQDRALAGSITKLRSSAPPYNEFYEEMLRPRQTAGSVIVTRPMRVFAPHPLERAWVSAIRPKPHLAATIDAYHEREFSGRPVLGLHIRHGNGEIFKRGNELTNGGPGVVLRLCQQHIAGLTLPREARCFVCTDSHELREALLAGLPNAFSYPSTVGRGGVGPIHKAHDGLEGAQDAIIEMWLLARCQWLAYTPSWFTYYARVMGEFSAPPVNMDSANLYGTAELYARRAADTPTEQAPDRT